MFRPDNLQRLKKEDFDLVIIGGGITGAGIALDAASRGIKTALIEMQDFAAGTSSRSTKLIHGGLRYLKQLEFGLVREVGLERAIVHKNAPHLVIPGKMLLPLVKGGSMTKTAASVGIYIYDYLAGVKKVERRRMLNKEQALEKLPFLPKETLLGAVEYTEYRTDDARLTIEIIKTAYKLGAIPVNYIKADSFIYENGKITGVNALDRNTGEIIPIKTKEIINAAGPWSDELRKSDNSLKGKHLKLSKGVHIVVPHYKFPIKQSLYFDVLNDKGRMVFAIPRERITYIGTTDTFYSGEISEPGVTKQDVDYILGAINQMFPTLNLKVSDVESTWSGLRPLIYEEGKSASELSRKDEIFYSDTGLITITGGKLTGYRKMAEKVVDVVNKRLSEKNILPFKKCYTDQITISGGDFESQSQIYEFIDEKIGECRQIPFLRETIYEMGWKYGKNLSIIIDKAYHIFSENRDHINPILEAEIWYSIHFESAFSLTDYFTRRAGYLYFNRPLIAQIREEVEEYFSKYLNWSSDRLRVEKEDLDWHIVNVLNFAN